MHPQDFSPDGLHCILNTGRSSSNQKFKPISTESQIFVWLFCSVGCTWFHQCNHNGSSWEMAFGETLFKLEATDVTHKCVLWGFNQWKMKAFYSLKVVVDARYFASTDCYTDNYNHFLNNFGEIIGDIWIPIYVLYDPLCVSSPFVDCLTYWLICWLDETGNVTGWEDNDDAYLACNHKFALHFMCVSKIEPVAHGLE